MCWSWGGQKEQGHPGDTRTAFVDRSCGKSCLTDGAGGGGALERVRYKRQLRGRGVVLLKVGVWSKSVKWMG